MVLPRHTYVPKEFAKRAFTPFVPSFVIYLLFVVCFLGQVFFCGATAKASELLNKGAAEAADFSLVVGASTWNVSKP